MDLVPQFGFKVRKQEFRNCKYTHKPDSMFRMEYDAVFFSAVKVADFKGELF